MIDLTSTGQPIGLTQVRCVGRHAGMTLVECVLALFILSLVILAVIYTAHAGHDHLRYGDARLRALRLAENLVEEILSRPYHGSGPTRDTFCVDDYDGFIEAAGSLRDVTGIAHPPADQVFSRAARVVPITLTVPDLDHAAIEGKTITVTVRDAAGNSWSISRFVPEPME